MKLYEIEFTFTPNDEETVGEGLVTISAESEDEAREGFKNFLDGVSDVEIVEVREVVDPNLPEGYVPPTLQ